ncbi:hypothetical protein TNCV_3780221 [Trichonephila clavipes]|nr:hypothetical protein TNCV_3780221 [Trichonephila clavipes]
MSSSVVPLKTRHLRKRCTLNLSRAQTSSRWRGVVIRRGVSAHASSSSLDHSSKLRSPRVGEQCDSNILSLTHTLTHSLTGSHGYQLFASES